jgi:adenylate cyclase
MGKEIERKFLVKDESFKSEAFTSSNIIQGYISRVPERTVRVRLEKNIVINGYIWKLGYLTIKGINVGATRYEWETEMEYDEAEELIKLCEPGVIEKIRHKVQVGKHVFEVDEFLGKNNGLVVAEIELKSEDEEFEKPDWLGEEVTDNPKYYNSNLKK